MTTTTRKERTGASAADEAVSFSKRTCNSKLAPVVIQTDVAVKMPGQKGRPVPVGPFVAATTVSISATCPSSCIFKRTRHGAGGCFADAGFGRITGVKLDRAGEHAGGVAVIEAEARAIEGARFRNGQGGGAGSERIPQDGARGGRDLRLHIGGDVEGERGAQRLALAAATWRSRGGGTVWTYTHRWREISRESWGRITVLASVERPEEVRSAHVAGYAAALVVAEHPTNARSYELPGVPGKVVPCPAETRRDEGVTCSSCRLCLDRDLLQLGITIAFAIHGRDSETARKRLRVLA